MKWWRGAENVPSVTMQFLYVAKYAEEISVIPMAVTSLSSAYFAAHLSRHIWLYIVFAMNSTKHAAHWCLLTVCHYLFTFICASNT